MNEDDRIFLAGRRGMVGSAIERALRATGVTNIIGLPSARLDLRDSSAVAAFFDAEHPDVVILAAAKVGGIQANRTYPADFMFDNLMIQTNVINLAHRARVKQFVFLGSSCIYPRDCPQPMKEEYLLTGPLEPTNEAYALAKIAGLRMGQYYARQFGMPVINMMPCNLYGPNDSFDPQHSHVLSALVKKFVDAADAGAEEVVLWGTGAARREFLHVDDCARALLFLLDHWHSADIINVGAGTDLTIKALAELIAVKVGYVGRLAWDPSMPDGMPRKCLDVSKIAALGFAPTISFDASIDGVIAEYRALKGTRDS